MGKPKKEVKMHCPSCNSEFPPYVDRPVLDSMGVVTMQPVRIEKCSFCGTGLERRITKTRV